MRHDWQGEELWEHWTLSAGSEVLQIRRMHEWR
jgi:hypothetical protein